MCGRYQFSQLAGGPLFEIAQAFMHRTGEPAPEGDICPGSFAPVLLEKGVFRMRWGYPSPSGKGLLINARAESAAHKPTFRQALCHRRCALPAQGFYEWDAQKRRYRFWLHGHPALYMAGLWDTFEGENRFVILTTAPNASMAGIHSRMPVLISSENLSLWLRDAAQAPALLLKQPPLCDRAPDGGEAAQLSFF